jgi:hypothetical protein
MKGRKGSTDEGGVRSPLQMRWPGRIAAGTVVKAIAGAIDLMPTLLGMTGVASVSAKPLDGIDVSPWLFGEEPAQVDRVLMQHWAGKVSARSQQYRLDAAGKLFDMANDPKQERDVSGDHPEEAKRLSEAVAKWKKEVLTDIVKKDERPYPVGYEAFPRTVLPARDGIAGGGIRRSANAPNCSYFTNWTSPKDRMTWHVEVAAAGRYEAIVQYTCAENDVGSLIELKLNAATWTGEIKEAHDPPLRGRERDRVPRAGESYMKEFRPLSLGIVELPKGRGSLSLQAGKVAGKQVADVRAVELILKP